MSLLVIEKLSKKFGGIDAVNDVSMVVNDGQIFAIIGPNGAGKTTVFNMITGMISPTAGRIVFKDQELQNLPSYIICQKGISRTFQNVRLFKNMTVLENVLVGFHTHTKASVLGSIIRSKQTRKEWKAVNESAIDLLRQYDLHKFKDYKARNLPYGYQRWLEIVRALATKPKLICLDEPAAGLNIDETKVLMERILLLRNEEGVTVLIIEHDMKLVMNISDHVVALDHGKKIAEGNPEEIRKNDDVIEAYLGKGYKKNENNA